jgi:hypothetical protein
LKNTTLQHWKIFEKYCTAVLKNIALLHRSIEKYWTSVLRKYCTAILKIFGK